MNQIKIFILILLCLSLWGCAKKEVVEDKPDYEFEFKSNYYASEIGSDRISMYVIELKGQGFTANTTIIPNKYAIDSDVFKESWRVFFDENGKALGYDTWNTEIKRFTVDIYDIKTNEKIKSIDVKNIFDNDENIKPYKSGAAGGKVYNGKLYITVGLAKTEEDKENEYKDTVKNLYIDIEDESYFENRKESISEEFGKEEKTYELGFSWIFTDRLLEQDGYSPYITVNESKWEGMTKAVIHDIYRIPEDNKMLYGLFPGLRENIDKLKAEGENARITFMLPDNMVEEEIIDMFFPEGEELSFDGVIVSAMQSVDGKPHKINNFDDFKKYMEPYEELKTRFKPILDTEGD